MVSGEKRALMTGCMLSWSLRLRSVLRLRRLISGWDAVEIRLIYQMIIDRMHCQRGRFTREWVGSNRCRQSEMLERIMNLIWLLLVWDAVGDDRRCRVVELCRGRSPTSGSTAGDCAAGDRTARVCAGGRDRQGRSLRGQWCMLCYHETI